MSTAPQDPHHEDRARSTGEGSPTGRRRGRMLIPAIFIAAILLVFVFIVLVSLLNR